MATLPLSLFKKIQRIKIQTEHLANDILAGAYRSTFKGKGMEFEEVREYQQGDDIRAIDWSVTARMGHPYVKSFREERELHVTLVVDISHSTRYGSGSELKADLIAEIAAVIAFSAISNNDKVALILFSDQVEKYIPPQKGTRHVLKVIRELLTFKPKSQGTNIGTALSFLGKVQTRSGICFLLSDFISPDYSREAALIAKKHDLVPIALVDPTETLFPNLNVALLTDAETQATYAFDTTSHEATASIGKTTTKRLIEQDKLMEKLGTLCCIIDSKQAYVPQLRKYFAKRREMFR